MTSPADMPGGRVSVSDLYPPPADDPADPLASLRYPSRRDAPTPPTELEALARALADAYERENHLLNQASIAHSSGWAEALAEVFSRIDTAFKDAEAREIPGLASAGRLLQELLARTLSDCPHRLDVAIVPGIDSPEYRVHCTAPPGAPCRVVCEGAAAGGCARGCTCGGDLVDADHCYAAADLDREGELFAGYVGVSRGLASGAIAVRPTPNGWEWLYAGDLPEGTTAQEWAGAVAA